MCVCVCVCVCVCMCVCVCVLGAGGGDGGGWKIFGITKIPGPNFARREHLRQSKLYCTYCVMHVYK